jgi:hypothetical protein
VENVVDSPSVVDGVSELDAAAVVADFVANSSVVVVVEDSAALQAVNLPVFVYAAAEGAVEPSDSVSPREAEPPVFVSETDERLAKNCATCCCALLRSLLATRSRTFVPVPFVNVPAFLPVPTYVWMPKIVGPAMLRLPSLRFVEPRLEIP